MAFISTLNINVRNAWQKNKETLWWNLSWLENRRIINKEINYIETLLKAKFERRFYKLNLKMMSKILIRINIALKLTIHRCISAWNINTWYISKDNTIMSDLTNFQKDQTVVSTDTKQIFLQRSAIKNTDNTISCKMAPPITLHMKATSSLQIFSNTNSKQTMII